MFGIFKKSIKNVMKVELALESMKIPFEKKGDAFVVYDNKYSNNGHDFTTLYINVTKDGVQFKDARDRNLTFLGQATQPEKVQAQLLNIFGLLSRRYLVTK